MLLKLHKKSKRAIRLLFWTSSYLVFGAIIFGFLEYESDIELRREIKESRNWLQQKYNFSAKDFERLEKTIIDSVPYAAGRQWKFLGALFFSTSVITTIGYGQSTPASYSGKLFYIAFALIGIPLGLITFQSTGERINSASRFCLIKLRSLLAKFGVHVMKEIKARHLLTVSLSLGSLTLATGTFVFHKQESWSWFDSFYYCVITLSTIGLGDRVAAQTNGRLDSDPAYVIFTLLFILLGLAIFSACINLLILEFMASNADIITARSRIRRLIQRSTSFKSATFNSFSSLTARSYKFNNSPNSATVLRKKPIDKIQNMYVYYKRGFSVRRPASTYIDHLVNTHSSKI